MFKIFQSILKSSQPLPPHLPFLLPPWSSSSLLWHRFQNLHRPHSYNLLRSDQPKSHTSSATLCILVYKGLHIQVNTAWKQWAWGGFFFFLIFIALYQRNPDDTEPTEDNTWKMAVLGMDQFPEASLTLWVRSLLFGPEHSCFIFLACFLSNSIFLLTLSLIPLGPCGTYFAVNSSREWVLILLQFMDFVLFKENNHPSEQ